MKRQIVAGLLIALATPSMAQNPAATWSDRSRLSPTYPAGRTEIQKITVNVSGVGAQQKI
jgi:hypothetical protein